MKSTTQAPKPVRRVGRPRQYDPGRALLAAMETFWKSGYAGTSLDDLAAATGMNRPSLYAAFGDKRALYRKTLERYRNDARVQASALRTDDPSLRIFLERFYGAALDTYFAGRKGRGCYSVVTATTEAAIDPEVQAFLAESVRSADAFLGQMIRNAQKLGEVNAAADPDALAQLAVATLHTLAVRARAGFTRKELERLAASAIHVICGATTGT